jgi:hypothetical protein
LALLLVCLAGTDVLEIQADYSEEYLAEDFKEQL